MRVNSGRPARLAAVAAVLLVAALASGAQAAAGEKVADVSLGYTCKVASRNLPVRVRISGVFPAAGTAGRAIRPHDVRTEITLPRAAVPGPGPLTGIAQLRTSITQNGMTAGAPWPILPVPPTAVPAAGDLVLTSPVRVPPVTVRGGGDVRFAVGDLSLLLVARRGTPLRPRCALAGGGEATVTVVPVAGRAAPAPRATPLDDDGDIPPECVRFEEGPPAGCTYVAGFTNVKKLGGAAFVRPGIMNVEIYDGVPCGPDDMQFCLNADGKLNYIPAPGEPGVAELPPSDATFLTFRFMPTRATMELTEVGLVRIEIVLDFNDFDNSSAKATIDVDIRLHNALVNGRKLDVGPRCQTVTPMHLVLTADPLVYSIQLGGVLSGYGKIPAFSGCGSGEDLDPLITGSISGPDNFVKMTQGSLCFFDPPLGGCPPIPPVPER
jgi:hypothetical protein